VRSYSRRNALGVIELSVCRVLLHQLAQIHDLSKHAAIDATFYDRSAASRHYYQRINYCVQKLKVTKLVDTDSQAVLDVHCSTTWKGSDADLAEQIARRNAGNLQSLAADKGYDKQSLREALRGLTIRTLITHRIFASYDHTQRQNRRTRPQSVFYDRTCQFGCEALARIRRASAFLVSWVSRNRADVCRL